MYAGVVTRYQQQIVVPMQLERKGESGKTQRDVVLQTALTFMQDLYAYALALSKDRDTARDLVQETYLKVTQAAERYRDQNMRAWLFKILKNTFLNWVKRKADHPTESFSEELHSGDQRVKNGISLPVQQWTESHYRELFSDEIFSALMKLPAEYREILLLREIEEFSYEELSELLGIPIGTVRSRLHRARQEMFKQLMQYPDFARRFQQQASSELENKT